MDPYIRHRLIHTIQHYLYQGMNADFEKVYDPPIERRCYKASKVTMVRNAQGEEVVSNIQLYFDGLFPTSANDLIQLDGKSYNIVAWQPFDGLKTGTGTTVGYL